MKKSKEPSKKRFFMYPPKNWSEVFKEMDNEQKQKHPVLYYIGASVSVLILLIPLFIFLSLSEDLTPARQPNAIEAWIELPFAILGVCGALSIGYGIANVYAAIVHQYLGHIVTILTIGIGLVACILSYCMLCIL